MRAFKWILIGLLVGAVASLYHHFRPIYPITTDFDVSRADSRVEMEIEIEKYLTYHFSIEVPFKDSEDQDYVHWILGHGSQSADGWHENPGVGIPIHLVVKAQDDGRVIVDKIVCTKGTVSRMQHAVKRLIWSMHLTEGKYYVSVSTTMNTPLLGNRKTVFSIRAVPKRVPPNTNQFISMRTHVTAY